MGLGSAPLSILTVAAGCLLTIIHCRQEISLSRPSGRRYSSHTSSRQFKPFRRSRSIDSFTRGLCGRSLVTTTTAKSLHDDDETLNPKISVQPLDQSIGSSNVLNLNRAVETAGFSFEVYTDPQEGEGAWERDDDGNEIAYLSPRFVRDAYQGLLEVRVVRASGLPMVSNPRADLKFGHLISQTKTTGINLGGSAQWGSGGIGRDGNERLGEIFYFYVTDNTTQELSFDVFSDSLTGLFTKKVGKARCPLTGLCDGQLQNVTLPVASADLDGVNLDIQVKWHEWSEAEEIAGIPLRIHDVTASGLQGLPVSYGGNINRMDTGRLVALLRASGLRTTGSRKELVERVKLAKKLREDSALLLLKSVRDLVGRNKTLEISNNLKAAASTLNMGLGMLKGDTFGAFTAALSTASKEIIGDRDWTKIRSDDLQSQDFQNRLLKARDKGQKAALARISMGMGLTSRKEGSAWHALLSAMDDNRREFDLSAFIENEETDTQAYIYRSKEHRSMVVAFRGTEQTKWKDIATDLMITPKIPAFAQAPIRKELKIRGLKGRKLSSDGYYSLDVRIPGAKEPLAVTETVKGGDIEWTQNIELSGVRTKEDIEVTLLRQEEDKSSPSAIGKVTVSAESCEGTWYPIGGRGPAQVYMDIMFGDEEIGEEKENGKGKNGGEREERASEVSDTVPQVHEGFLRAYNSIRRRVLALIDDTVDRDNSGKDWKIYVTGHSLGGALATLLSYELGVRQRDGRGGERLRIKKYSFGSPRVGNAAFAKEYDEIVKESWRLFNSKDVIATVPRMLKYSHVKTGVLIDSSNNTIKFGAASRQDQQCSGDDCDLVEMAVYGIDIDNLKEDLSNPQQLLASLSTLIEKSSISRIMDSELERLSMLTDGSAIAEHLEDLYFYALQRVIIREMEEEKVMV